MLETSFRTLLGFVVLLALTRILGKKQISQLSVFTFITGIVLGEIAGEMIINKDTEILDCVLALILWCALVLAVEFISLKSARARILMDGEPAIVIKKGHIQEKELKKHRLNLGDLSMRLRMSQVFSIMDVEYAILEPSGALTVMKKQSKEPVVKEDMHIPPGTSEMPSEIIVDGNVVEKNLLELRLTRQWLDGELRKQGISNIKTVFYAELQQDGSLHVQKRE